MLFSHIVDICLNPGSITTMCSKISLVTVMIIMVCSTVYEILFRQVVIHYSPSLPETRIHNSHSSKGRTASTVFLTVRYVFLNSPC